MCSLLFQQKIIIFAMSIPVPKALTGKGWADIHNGKRRFCTLWF